MLDDTLLDDTLLDDTLLDDTLLDSSFILYNIAMETNNFGLVRVAVASPSIVVADPQKNAETIVKLVLEADKKSVSLLVMPELSLTGCSCQDLLFQTSLIESAKKMLIHIAEKTSETRVLFSVGLPLFVDEVFCSAQAWVYRGEVLAIAGKPEGPLSSNSLKTVYLDERFSNVLFTQHIVIQDNVFPAFSLTSVIGADLFGSDVSILLESTSAPAIIVHHGSDPAFVDLSNDKNAFLMTMTKARYCACLFATAPPSESTSGFVYSAHNLIVERGRFLAESYFEEDTLLITEVDFERISIDRGRKKARSKNSSFFDDTVKNARDAMYAAISEKVLFIGISLLDGRHIGNLNRWVKKDIFIAEKDERASVYSHIFQMQVHGLKKRMQHIKTEKVILGLSGGLDSTLALIAASKTIASLGLDSKNILAVSMPGFGTTERTRTNAKRLAEVYGATFLEISIEKAVEQHFRDIGHDKNVHDVVYENSQARERTQILMDLANKENALLLGTGNMSELALGWTTYNGDHMSMYALNSSIPKTLVQDLVRYEAELSDQSCQKADPSVRNSKQGLMQKAMQVKQTAEKKSTQNVLARAEVLRAILDTPISPELLPPAKGEIAQKTEHLIGPYILHVFFMFYILRFGFSPKKIFFLACEAFIHQDEQPEFTEAEILSWLKIFYKRFFAQQFKRSCAPDGVSIGSLSFFSHSWNMPSDASANIWLRELEEIGL